MAYNDEIVDPAQQYKAKKNEVATMNHESRLSVRRLMERLDEHRKEREAAMKAAATHAGNIGFVYDAEKNEYMRVVSGLREPEMPVAPPPLVLDQTQFDMATARVEAAEREAVAELERRLEPSEALPNAGIDKWYKSIPEWTIAIVVGTFIGYGLGKITGLPIDRQPILLGLFLALGAGVIVGLKLLLHKMWEEYGRSVRRNTASKWLLALVTLLTGAFCAAEASLGANALVTYSKRVAFTSAEALSFGIALLIAAAISTPILLFSAFKGYGRGISMMTVDEERLQLDAIREDHRRVVDENLRIRQESAAKQLELLQRQWEADLLAKQESHVLKMREYEAECKRRREIYEKEKCEFDHYKTAPDYEALLTYVGRVNALNVQIAETELALSKYSAGNGVGRANNGSDLPEEVNNEVRESA
jgi:hypothetical protein